MGRTSSAIDDRTAAFVTGQPVFFVATAPLDGAGHVNCSPTANRGELVVLDEHRVAYLDQTGSGVETIAHLQENGRIVLMACAFEGPPRIVRLHGRGEVVTPADPRFTTLARRFPRLADEPDGDPWPGPRSVVVVTVDRVSESCGFGVPLLAFAGHRRQMDDWARRKGADGLVEYQARENATSIDGLLGLPGLPGPAGPAGAEAGMAPAGGG